MIQQLFKTVKRCGKIFMLLILPNEGDDLILRIDAKKEHWSAVLKIKEGEKLCKYCNEWLNKEKCNYRMMKTEILTVIRKIEKFLIFLPPKYFPIWTNYKDILDFAKKNLSNMQV